jgi:hypothetical protein
VLNDTNDTTILLREVWSNRDGVSRYKVIYRPHRAVSSASPDVDTYWHTLCNWQPCEQPWVEIYGVYD